MTEFRTNKKTGKVHPISSATKKQSRYADNNQLVGHTSQETAYLVDDYPYGYNRRTKIRYWVETTKRGQRFVSQTMNPSTGKWNNPKKTTYYGVMIMAKDEKGHVTYHTADYNDKETKLQLFQDMYKLDKDQKEKIKMMTAYDRGMKHVKWEFKTVEPGEEHDYKKNQEENRKKVSKAVRYEYGKME